MREYLVIYLIHLWHGIVWGDNDGGVGDIITDQGSGGNIIQLCKDRQKFIHQLLIDYSLIPRWKLGLTKELFVLI